MYWSLLSRVSLSVAESRQVGDTLVLIVEGLVNEIGFALARIWLIEPVVDAGGTSKILRLRASAGTSIAEPGRQWTDLGGGFSRIVLGQSKVGRVGSTGEPIVIEDLATERTWVANPEWVANERMVSFAAHPLVFKGEVLGVLGVFTRERVALQRLQDLRLFADHAAVSLANARAFEELNELRSKLELENTYLQEEVRESISYSEILSRSEALRRILQQLELVAPTEASVLILGESGTGKELIARAIHERSKRKGRPLVKVNCAAVPRELFESEFFGHAKGSFTSAIKDRVGRFQLADQGTLFLDEVGEIPIELQSKLLRVLEEGEFERVGEDSTRRVSVRLIAATNRELAREAEVGRFREDLYYRLSVFPIVVPPLRQRKEDIPLLAAHFITRSSRRIGIPEARLTEENLQILTSYEWPGNIRELQHVIERAVILGRGQALLIDLPEGSHSITKDAALPVSERASAPKTQDEILTMEELRQLEVRNYRAALKRAGGKIYGAGGAASLLGIPATTLSSRVKALGIDASPQSLSDDKRRHS